MEESIEIVRRALQEECGLDASRVTAKAHLLDDLEVDSLDLLNACFRIEKVTGTKLPVQDWIDAEYKGQKPAESPFLVETICKYLDAKREPPR